MTTAKSAQLRSLSTSGKVFTRPLRLGEKISTKPMAPHRSIKRVDQPGVGFRGQGLRKVKKTQTNALDDVLEETQAASDLARPKFAAQRGEMDTEAKQISEPKKILPNENGLPAASASDVQLAKPDYSATFGIPSEKLADKQGDTYIKFLEFKEQALAWQEEKAAKGSYETKYVNKTEKNPDGDPWVTRKEGEEKLGVQHQAWQSKTGKEIEKRFIEIANSLHKLTGCPRTTGSQYLTEEPKEDLLSFNKQVFNDGIAATAAPAKALNQVPIGYAEHESPTLEAQLTPEAALLAGVSVVPAAMDTAFALGAHLRLETEIGKAKNDVNRVHSADRFHQKYVEGAKGIDAGSKEAEDMVAFAYACGKVFEPTQEDKSTRKAAKARVERAAGWTGVGAIATSIAVADAVAPIAPGTNGALLPLTVGTSLVEYREGKEEVKRRMSQKEQALSRKNNIAAVLSNPECQNHEDYSLAVAIGDCFDRQLDRQIQQADREGQIGQERIFKAGANLGTAAAAAISLGVLASQSALSVLTAGASLVVPAVVGGVWSGRLFYRNWTRWRDDHENKWNQRMSDAIALTTPREELEDSLLSNTSIEFEQERGEYLPEEDRFAGERKMKLDARDNEYLGLRVLALKIQDMVKTGNYDETSPCMQLVHQAFGIDHLLLFAICMAAKPKKPAEQLAYIESQLALKMGMKVRLAGATQAPPHVSVFLQHFKTARDEAFLEKAGEDFKAGRKNDFDADAWSLTPDSPELYPRIREKLAELYPNDSQAGLEAFDKAIETFLKKIKNKKTGDLPQTQFVKTLKGFYDYSARSAALKKADAMKRANRKRNETALIEAAENELALNKAFDDFKAAQKKVLDEKPWRLSPDSTDLYPEIRKKLAALHPDDPGLKAFDTTIRVFLEKREDLPKTQFVETLKGFHDYSAALGSPVAHLKRVQRELVRKKPDSRTE